MAETETELKDESFEAKPAKKWDVDDKDLAMIGIVVLCCVGGLILWAVAQPAAAIGALFTGGVTALGSLASGRKNNAK